MTKFKEKNDFWDILYTLGKILLLAPALIAALGILYAVLTHTNVGFEGNVGLYIMGLPMASVFLIMVCTSYRTFRKAGGIR